MHCDLISKAGSRPYPKNPGCRNGCFRSHELVLALQFVCFSACFSLSCPKAGEKNVTTSDIIMSPFSSTFYRGLVKCGSCISFQRNSKNLKLSQLSTEFPESVPKVWVQARSLGDPAEVLLFDKVQAQDVQQGRLGDCWSSQLCLGRFGTVVDSCWYFWCLFLVVTWWLLTFDMWRDSSLCSRQHSDSSVILIVFCDRAQLACFYVQTGVFLLFF